uniref:LEM domain-containing protein n=1 Tax=Mesocestoides corti TaxID=53468 RepID=A0A5K3ERZ0_MESCO
MSELSYIRTLSDDDLRDKLEENGCRAPPITDDAVREVLRRKLFKLLYREYIIILLTVSFSKHGIS